MPGRWDLSGKLPRSRPPSSQYQPGSTRCLSRRPHRSEGRLGANGSPPPIGSYESGGGHARKNKNIGTRSLQDRDMPIDKLVQHIKGDIDNDQAGQIAESFLNSLEEVPPKLVVLPKRHDVALRIEGLDVVGVDSPLGTKRRLPAHGPRKRLRVAQLLGAEATKSWGIFLSFRKLRTAKFPAVPNDPNITGRCPSRPARGSDRAQPLDRNCHHRKMKRTLRPLMPPRSFDHVEIGRFGLSNRGRSGPVVLVDLDQARKGRRLLRWQTDRAPMRTRRTVA